MKKIASSSGCVLIDKDDKIYVIRTSSGSLSVALFVFILLTVILFANGIIMTAMAASGKAETLFPGIILVLAGIICLMVSVFLFKKRKHATQINDVHKNLVCIFDVKNKNILDENGKIISSFSGAFLDRRFQATSSSKKLVLVCENEEFLIAKGNPFDGGTYSLESAIRSIGING